MTVKETDEATSSEAETDEELNENFEFIGQKVKELDLKTVM